MLCLVEGKLYTLFASSSPSSSFVDTVHRLSLHVLQNSELVVVRDFLPVGAVFPILAKMARIGRFLFLGAEIGSNGGSKVCQMVRAK